MNNRVVALSAAICGLLVSGVAFAQKVPFSGSRGTSSGASTNSPEGTPTLTIQIPVAAVTREICNFAAINPFNVTQVINLGPNAVITGIGGSGTLTAFSPSWQSEVAVLFRGAVPAETIRFRGFVPTDAPGTSPFSFAPVDLSTNVPPLPNITLGPSGNLTVEFCETFDDTPGSATVADGQFNTGTLLTIQCFNCFDPFREPPLAAPAMSTWSLITLLLGLGLVGGIAVRRYS